MPSGETVDSEAGSLEKRPAPVAAAMQRGLLGLQRLVVRTQAGPLRPLWALCYRAAVRLLAALVRWREREATVYVRGSLAAEGAIYGLSDIDFSIVVRGDPDEPGAARRRLRRRARRLAGRLPGRLRELLYSRVYEDGDLDRRGGDPVFVYGLDGGAKGIADRSVYFAPEDDWDLVSLHERPGVYGPMGDWRRVAGAERRSREGRWDVDRRRMAAWLELQHWWSRTAMLCARPEAAGAAYMAVKLVAEPARLWLWLAEGEQCASRVEALRRGRERLRGEADAFEQALELHRRLPERPAIDLDATLGALTRLSSLIADHLARELEPLGTTAVALLGDAEDALMLAEGAWAGLPPASPPRPLVDWRALAWPQFPDEAFVTLAASPTDPAALASCADVAHGPYPTLVADGLLIRPTGAHTQRAHLRSVHCRISDPVSFALRDSASVARFPRAPGWSAEDWARRASAEHAAWLAARPSVAASGDTLAMLISAARAALFLETARSVEPQLSLTVASTLRALGADSDSGRGAAEAAAEAYREFVERGQPPTPTAVGDLERVVRRMAPYRKEPA
jgi:predicted nucleotidyltransferase